MKPYAAVIFDLDGTLLDTLEDLTGAVNHAMRECGYPEHTMEEVRGFVGNGIGLLIQRALPADRDADAEACALALQAFKSYYAQHNNDATAPYPGACELLGALRAAGIKTAVLSNKNDSNVKALCGHYFPGLIDEAVGERGSVRRKPEPDAVYSLMEAFRVTPEQTLYVGDSDVDVQTAQNAGTDCAAVLWGFRPERCLREAGARELFSTPDALMRWILG